MRIASAASRPHDQEDRTTDGWEEVVADLVRTRRPQLTGYAYLLCGSLAEAEDLVQDAIVAMLVRSPARRSVDTPEAYVRTAIRHTYVDGFRRRRRWAQLRHLHVVRDDEPTAGDPPGDHVPGRIDLQRALAALSPRERACVVLRFYDDLTVAQIADSLSLSSGAVKRYLFDGVHKLAPLVAPQVLEVSDE